MSSFIMLGLLALVIEMISRNIGEVIKTAPMYQKNIQVLFQNFLLSFGLSELPSMMELAKQVDITNALSRVAGSLTVIAGNTGIILIYVIFLLLEQRSMESKLDSLFKEPERRNKIHEILSEIQKDIETYIAIKTLLSVATGLLSYIILISIGVDYAEFWAFLIFIELYTYNWIFDRNYISYITSTNTVRKFYFFFDCFYKYSTNSIYYRKHH